MKQFIAAGTIKMAILVVAVCIGMAVTEAQSQVNYVDQSWNWTYETWTGNDTEYKEVAAKLNAQVAKGKDLDKSYWSYVAAAKKNINDPMAQFRRAYFLVSCDWGKKLKLSPPKTSVATEIQAAWYGVANVKSPQCREFSRIRFLLNFKVLPQPQLKPMAKRLYESNPRDHGSKYAYASLLKSTGKRDEVLVGLKLAQEMAETWPVEPHYRALVGACYMSLWSNCGNCQSDLKESIKHYEKALSLSKDSASIRTCNVILEARRKQLK